MSDCLNAVGFIHHNALRRRLRHANHRHRYGARFNGAQRPRVMARYVFPSREAFDRYVREVAPALRAEGLAKFGPQTGVLMERSVSEVAG